MKRKRMTTHEEQLIQEWVEEDNRKNGYTPAWEETIDELEAIKLQQESILRKLSQIEERLL